jgi:hypothetical protein
MAEQQFDLNSLLDGTLDDIADLPSFKPWPTGAYKAVLTLTQKEISKHPAVEAKFKLIEILQLADASEVAEEDIPKVGDESSMAFMLDNEFGQGNFKKIMAASTEKFGTASNREHISNMQNAEVNVVLTVRPDKTDKEKFYQQLTEIAVA